MRISRLTFDLANVLLSDRVLTKAKNKAGTVTDEALFYKLVFLNLLPIGLNLVQFGLYCRASEQQLTLFRHYQPSAKLTSKVSLIQAEQGLVVASHRAETIDHIQSWCDHPLDISNVAGNHFTVIDNSALSRQLLALFI